MYLKPLRLREQSGDGNEVRNGLFVTEKVKREKKPHSKGMKKFRNKGSHLHS